MTSNILATARAIVAPGSKSTSLAPKICPDFEALAQLDRFDKWCVWLCAAARNS